MGGWVGGPVQCTLLLATASCCCCCCCCCCIHARTQPPPPPKPHLAVVAQVDRPQRVARQRRLERPQHRDPDQVDALLVAGHQHADVEHEVVPVDLRALLGDGQALGAPRLGVLDEEDGVAHRGCRRDDLDQQHQDAVAGGAGRGWVGWRDVSVRISRRLQRGLRLPAVLC